MVSDHNGSTFDSLRNTTDSLKGYASFRQVREKATFNETLVVGVRSNVRCENGENSKRKGNLLWFPFYFLA